LTFNRNLSDAPIDEPEVPELMHAILASLPRRAFHSDGTLRTSLERRIIADRMRLERRGTIDLNEISLQRTPPKSITPGGEFFLRAPLDS
jgi:hypothetical protein